jgi:hypothetical protein
LVKYITGKQVLGSCFGGGKPVGRPRNRWEAVIQRGVTNLLLIRTWEAAARDEKWRKKIGGPWLEHGPKRGGSTHL